MITSQLDHPNIVSVYGIDLDEEGYPLMAMRYVRGRSWSSLLDADFKGGNPPTEYLFKHLNILIQVMNAVAYAHSKGVIHCDLKPSQVVIGEYGEVQLLDWGIALLEPDSPILRSTILPEDLIRLAPTTTQA
ncbi:MAG: hypothetical protein EI684_02910, partial [Candidatus Viridilinea halotolerans]